MKYLILLLTLLSSAKGWTQAFTDMDADIIQVNFGAAAFGDFDGDGDDDLAICGSEGSNSSSTVLYRNNNGDFEEVFNTLLPNITLGALEFADFNNDGFDDLLLQGYIESSEIATSGIFKSNGDGSFTSITIDIPQVYQGGLDWADFNNDGYLDFAISGFDDANSDYITKIYKNNQDETFTELSTGFPGTFLGRVKWGDYDGDSYDDLLITGFGFTGFITEIWHNNQNETFSPSAIPLQLCWLGDAEWADYDNDNDLDLLLTGDNGGVKYTILYKNNSGGNFEPDNQPFSNLSHTSVEWADFDNDGDLDLFLAGTANAMGTGSYSSTVYLNTDGNFSVYQDFEGTYWGDCRVSDFNNDGYPDLLINGYNNTEQPYSALFLNGFGASISEIQLQTKIYPNPAQNLLNIACEQPLLKVMLYDCTGKLCYDQQTHSKELQIDINHFDSGVYSLTIITKNGLFTKNVTIQ